MSEQPVLTEYETDLLRRSGEFFINGGLLLMGETLAWGIYLLVMIFAICIICGKGVRGSRPRQILLTVTLVMFSCSTAIYALDLYTLFIQVKNVLLAGFEDGQTFGDRIDSTVAPYAWCNYFGTLLFSFEFFIGDAVVLWRTWVLWSGRRYFVALPLTLWIASIVNWFAFIGIASQVDFNAGEPHEVTGSLSWKLDLATNALSIGTNAVSTSMIAFKAWEHRRVIKASLGPATPATKVEKVLALLVESGFIYLVLWIAQVLGYLYTEYDARFVVFGVFTYMMRQIVGLYPTIIVVVVELQRTVWDSPEVSEHLTSLRFAAGAQPAADAEAGEGYFPSTESNSGSGRAPKI